jgi:hypothetical protein
MPITVGNATQQEKDRDSCPKIINLGSVRVDQFYERKEFGFDKRPDMTNQIKFNLFPLLLIFL